MSSSYSVPRVPSTRLGPRPPNLRTTSSSGRSSPLRQSWGGEIKVEEGGPNNSSRAGPSALMDARRGEDDVKGGENTYGDDKTNPFDVDVKNENQPPNFSASTQSSFLTGSCSPSSVNGDSALNAKPTPTRTTSESTPSSRRKEAQTKADELSKRRAFINHLPRAEAEALGTFTLLQENLFQNKGMGRSGQTEDMMFCECSFDPDSDDPDVACGPHSNCINRLTQVECLKDECQTNTYCQNQRFSRREYSDVQVVKTEKKGYGLRAGSDIQAESFIQEYIGEVVTPPVLAKRMQDYVKEGIPHFYFMMLQKEEYLDATKKGGIARFANHSCNPNCHVQKWVVGKRVRMGIFAMRDIEQGEEMTFNYNVDRYGHTAQTCYCEEPNCVGTIGGKTQTDIGGLDDLYIEALGIADEVAALEAKGSKKKKSRKLDEDFTPTLHPLDESEVPKMVAALRQSTENRKMLLKLLERVQMTNSAEVQTALMRMHGFSLFTSVLNAFPDDEDVLVPALSCLSSWKLAARNKVDDSKIEERIQPCTNSSNATLARLAQGLLAYWSSLTSIWRIPRKIHVADTEDDAAAGLIEDTREVPASEAVQFTASWTTPTTSKFELTKVQHVFRPRQPLSMPAQRAPAPLPASASFDAQARLESILALAKSNQVQAAVPLVSNGESSKKRERAKEPVGDERRKRSRPGNDASREKRLTKVVGEFVVRTMSKYKDQMERETFKRYAKECTQVLVEKEKKGKSWQQGDEYQALTEDKKAKMKSFIKEYAHKILKKLKEKGKLLDPHRDVSRRTSEADSSRQGVPGPGSANSMEDDALLVRDMFGPDLGEDDLEEDGSHTGSSRDRMEEDLETPELASPREKPAIATTPLTPGTPPTPPQTKDRAFGVISGY